MYVQELMTRTPVTVTEQTEADEAVDLLFRHHVSLLPVVDSHGRIRGVVSEIDLIRDSVIADPRTRLIPPPEVRRPSVARVCDVMSSPAVSVHPTTDLAEVVRLMATARLKSLPVVDEGDRVVGLISRSDVIGVQARPDADLARDVSSCLAQMGHHDWLVEVLKGVVDIQGPGNELDRSLADLAGRSVAGVVSVNVHEPHGQTGAGV